MPRRTAGVAAGSVEESRMPTSSMRRVGALLDLARETLPQPVNSDGNYRDWNLVAPAFLGLGAGALEAVFQLPPPRHRVAAETVARSLVEYTITFAWLAAPNDEDERAERLARFEISEYNDRLEADKRYTTILPERNDGAYAALIAEGRMPSSLAEPQTQARIAAIKDEPGAKGMPPLLDRATQADAVWMRELDVVATQPLANVYAGAFAHFSFSAHAASPRPVAW